MKTIIFYSVCCMLIFSVPAQEKKVDISEAEVNFIFTSKEVEGTVGDLQLVSKIDLNQLEDAVIEGSVSLESLKTGNFLRDWHLMSKKYFYKKKYPRIYFKSTRILKNEKGYQINGNLRMKGISKSVPLNLQILKNKLLISGIIYTSDWGINVMDASTDNEVRFEILIPIQ